MTKLSELLGLGDDRRIRRDRVVGGRAQVRGNVADERRNVIEQLSGRKDFVRRNDEQLVQARQPSCRERLTLGGDALRDDPRESVSSNGVHSRTNETRLSVYQ